VRLGTQKTPVSDLGDRPAAESNQRRERESGNRDSRTKQYVVGRFHKASAPTGARKKKKFGQNGGKISKMDRGGRLGQRRAFKRNYEKMARCTKVTAPRGKKGFYLELCLEASWVSEQGSLTRWREGKCVVSQRGQKEDHEKRLLGRKRGALSTCWRPLLTRSSRAPRQV